MKVVGTLFGGGGGLGEEEYMLSTNKNVKQLFHVSMGRYGYIEDQYYAQKTLKGNNPKRKKEAKKKHIK
jgi:hypothetical protein